MTIGTLLNLTRMPAICARFLLRNPAETLTFGFGSSASACVLAVLTEPQRKAGRCARATGGKRPQAADLSPTSSPPRACGAKPPGPVGVEADQARTNVADGRLTGYLAYTLLRFTIDLAVRENFEQIFLLQNYVPKRFICKAKMN